MAMYPIHDSSAAVTTIKRNVFSAQTPPEARRFILYRRARIILGATSSVADSRLTLKIGGRLLLDRILLPNTNRYPILDKTVQDLIGAFRGLYQEEIVVDVESVTSATIQTLCRIISS